MQQLSTFMDKYKTVAKEQAEAYAKYFGVSLEEATKITTAQFELEWSEGRK